MFFRKFHFFIFILLINFSSCSQKEEVRTQSLLGTVCQINLFKDGTKKLHDELFQKIAQIENDFSVNIASSYISQINKAAGKEKVFVPKEVSFVLENALYFAKITDGVFDPTVGPLVTLWGINTEHARVPSSNEIERALKLVNYKNIDFEKNSDGSVTVKLLEEGMAIDLGGIVKGYVADSLVATLQRYKVKCAIIDLGGNIYAYGKKSDGSAWKIGIKNPASPESEVSAILRLKNSSVVTSGVYERFFEEAGMRYHHILDTRTGYPSESGVLSSTIVFESSMVCDALSTSVFALGKERGMLLINKINQDLQEGKTFFKNESTSLFKKVSVVFIDNAGDIFASKDLEGALQTTSRIPFFAE
ncbi:MAG: FAD:protein FMN transferase [Treponema sp.]|nr:FAD:protein FMN transferase [Treponema sp.]